MPRSNVVVHGLGVTGVALGQAALAIGAGTLAGRLVGHGEHALAWASVGAGGAIVKALAGVVVARGEARTAQRAARALRSRALAGIFSHGAEALGRTTTLLVAVRSVERAILAGALGTVKSVVQLAPLLVGLVVVAPPVAAIAVVVLGPFALLLRRFRGQARARERAALAAAAAVDERIDDALANADLLRTLAAHRTVAERLAGLEGEAETHVLRAAELRAGLGAANEVLAALAVVALVAVVGSGAFVVPVAALVPALSLVFLAYRPLRDLGDARAAVRAGDAALAELAPVLAPSIEGQAITADRAALEVVGFGAKRHDRRWSFSVAPGEIVAVTGPTGSGKTTLLRALLGLDEAEGALRYGEASLAGAAVGTARPFAWVPQEAPLVLGTAAENAALGTGGDAGAELAVLGPAISLDGEEQARLSGGERALLALARAVATDRPVLLLDEPTASLDAEAEARVLARIEALRGKRSVVIVTHRASTAAVADRVI